MRRRCDLGTSGQGKGVAEQTEDAAVTLRPSATIGLAAIFAVFFRLGITSFGGNTAAWLYRDIVERRRWIDDPAFLTGLALSRILPGSGGVSLTVQVGQRLHGAAGAVVAVLGLLSGPLMIVVALAAGWRRLEQVAVLQAVLDGMGAAAVGLTFATGLKLLPSGGRLAPLAVTLATVVGVGVLRWPLVPVVLVLAPLAIGIELVLQRRVKSAADA
jgi:chromate transporter